MSEEIAGEEESIFQTSDFTKIFDFQQGNPSPSFFGGFGNNFVAPPMQQSSPFYPNQPGHPGQPDAFPGFDPHSGSFDQGSFGELNNFLMFAGQDDPENAFGFMMGGNNMQELNNFVDVQNIQQFHTGSPTEFPNSFDQNPLNESVPVHDNSVDYFLNKSPRGNENYPPVETENGRSGMNDPKRKGESRVNKGTEFENGNSGVNRAYGYGGMFNASEISESTMTKKEPFVEKPSNYGRFGTMNERAPLNNQMEYGGNSASSYAPGSLYPIHHNPHPAAPSRSPFAPQGDDYLPEVLQHPSVINQYEPQPINNFESPQSNNPYYNQSGYPQSYHGPPQPASYYGPSY